MLKVLVTGALGQVGSGLVPALRRFYGTERVLATDIRGAPAEHPSLGGPYEQLDCTNGNALRELLERYRIKVIYHLAAILSARAEADPQLAWRVNMEGLYNVLEVARQINAQVFVPSSIAAFGPNTP